MGASQENLGLRGEEIQRPVAERIMDGEGQLTESLQRTASVEGGNLVATLVGGAELLICCGRLLLSGRADQIEEIFYRLEAGQTGLTEA